jgi:hypothetical protein
MGAVQIFLSIFRTLPIGNHCSSALEFGMEIQRKLNQVVVTGFISDFTRCC